MEGNAETRAQWQRRQVERREIVHVGSSRVKGLADFLQAKEEGERNKKQQSAALTLHEHYEQQEEQFLLALNHYHQRHALRHIETEIEYPFTSHLQTQGKVINILPNPHGQGYRVTLCGLNSTDEGEEVAVRLDFERSSIWVGDQQFEISEFLQDDKNMRKIAAVHADPEVSAEDKMIQMALTIFKGVIIEYFSRRELTIVVKSLPNGPHLPLAAAASPQPSFLSVTATSSNMSHLLGNFLRTNKTDGLTYFVGCQEGIIFLVYLCQGQNCVKLFKKRSRYEDNWLAEMTETQLLKTRGFKPKEKQEGSRVIVMNVGSKGVSQRDLLKQTRQDVAGLMRGIHRDKLMLLLQRAHQMT